MRSVSSSTRRQLARLDFSPEWEVRLVDQDSRVYPIPPRAIKGRQRGTELDGSTWRLTLSLERSLLPSGVAPAQYHRVEMDLLLGSDRIPYFRGIIDHPRGGESLQGGAITEPLELQAFGMLQKTKGYRVSTYRVDPTPVSPSTTYQLLGLCRTERFSPNTPVGAGQSEFLPSGAACYNAGSSAYFKIYTSNSMTATYTSGVDYTLDLTSSPVKINWINAPNLGRLIQFSRLERFVYPTYADKFGYNYAVMPYGRNYDDLYPTTVADVVVDPTQPRIRLADASGWLAFAVYLEIAAITLGDGTQQFERVNAMNPDGWVYFQAGVDLSHVQIGDPIRLATTEHYQAWDDDRLIRFFTNSIGTTEWNRRYIRPIPNAGIAEVMQPRNWTETVYSDLAYVRQDYDPNRMEERIAQLLTGLGLFTDAEITRGKSGVYAKNFTFTAQDADQILALIATNSLLPNTFIHDEPDGKISILSYQQKTAPDWVMRGAHDIQEADQPEPITAVTVIAETSGEGLNMAPSWFYGSTNFNNPERATDGNLSDDFAAVPSSTTGQATMTFRVPRCNPLTAFPMIDRIRVTGKGLLSVYVTRADGPGGSLVSYYVPGWTFTPITSGTAEISGDDLHRVLTLGSNFDYQELTCRFDPITRGDNLSTVTVDTVAACSEIQIQTKQIAAWKAEITDDTAKTAADNGAASFGTVWRQSDTAKRESWRYAPPEYVKRTSVLYAAPPFASKPRNKILRFDGISQQACRDYAERWLDYKLMEGKTYTVQGILDPRAQLGDTVRIFRKDGTWLDLFFWGIEDGGGPDDLGATYHFRNYA